MPFVAIDIDRGGHEASRRKAVMRDLTKPGRRSHRTEADAGY